MYKEPFDPDAPFDVDTASELEVLEWMNSVTAWAEENEKEGFQILLLADGPFPII